MRAAILTTEQRGKRHDLQSATRIALYKHPAAEIKEKSRTRELTQQQTTDEPNPKPTKPSPAKNPRGPGTRVS